MKYVSRRPASRFRWFTLVLALSLVGCSKKMVVLPGTFSPQAIPAAPDYRNVAHWAALPDKLDSADKLPAGVKDENQSQAKADVFFIHPTTYTYQPPSAYPWNGDVNDAVLNVRTDQTAILNQASVFNESCRVYAPRYRQAHYYAFITNNPEDKRQALDLAYEDVRTAFGYYLQHYNQGRPIVIAAHSQGSLHAIRLLKEFFDGKPLQQQLVEAYLVGWQIPSGTFNSLQLSTSAKETGGFVTWNTYARNYYPKTYRNGLNRALCTNPLTWTTDSTFASTDLNQGGVDGHFRLVPHLSDAQCHGGMLWIRKPHVRGRALVYLFYPKRWHVADYNLFWMNVRENVAQRVESFTGSK